MVGNPSIEMPIPVLRNQADITTVEYKATLWHPCLLDIALRIWFSNII